MRDIVERLQAAAKPLQYMANEEGTLAEVALTAADEILWLREEMPRRMRIQGEAWAADAARKDAEITRLREEVERLTSQRNDLMKAILRQSDEVGDEYRERHGTATTYESALQMLTSMNGEMERLYRLVERLRAQLELAESINKGTARQINRERANVAQLQAELNRRV